MVDLKLESFCQLISAERSHQPIELEDGKPLLIGRGPLTLITDRKLSRNHVEVTANFSAKELTIKQLGAHSSRVAGKELAKGSSAILGDMGRFELVADKYKYHVHFGQRVPEAVLRELQAGADSPSCNNGEAEVEEDLTSSDVVRSGRKRTRESNEGEGEPDNAEEISPAKKLKVDQPVPHVGGPSKPVQQRSLTAFYKPDSGVDSDTPPAEPMKVSWDDRGTMLVMKFGDPVNSQKIASYDLDGTLIETESGRKFAKSYKDWKLMFRVADKLRSLCKDGYKIVIISNQLGIAKGKPPVGDFKLKAEAIARKLNVPLLLLAATAKDKFRKPCVAMWEHLLASENGGVAVDPKESFYVGDAAGREANWKHGAKKDFSCTDRKFAANLDLPFQTPEEHFHGLPKCSKFTWGEFDPRALDYSSREPKLVPSDAKLHSDKQEVVVFVGCPASGKSSFYAKHMKPKGYIHVNRDTLGSWQKCVSECSKVLSAGKSVVVDNTSPDKDSRSRYIEVACQHKVPVRCFQFMTTLAHAKHNNRFRELTLKSSSYVKVNDMVFNMYKSKFCEPEIGEGFSEIVKIHFTPCFSDNDYHAELYRNFLE